MNGAEHLVQTLVENDVNVCFANPGTTEMHIVNAMDQVDGMRPVLCLFEGVATGAADGYARMTGRPASTLLHLGPGFANGVANLHNAKRAKSPIVNLIGDHPTYHIAMDAPLTSDVDKIASFASHVVSTATIGNLGAETVAAVEASLAAGGQVSTLVVPADVAWSDYSGPHKRAVPPLRPGVDLDRIRACANALRAKAPAALFMSGAALTDPGLDLVAAIGAKVGCRLVCDTFNARTSRGGDRPAVPRLPYFPELARASLEDLNLLVTVGTRPPVAFFAYPDKPSDLVSERTTVLSLAEPHEDVLSALAALADELGAVPVARQASAGSGPLPTGPLTALTLSQALAALMPENAIVSDESGVSALATWGQTVAAPRHDWLQLMGGAIGQGFPVATGAAIACPDRKVICINGDGGAMYTLQSLWTQARERLDVVTIVLANRKYSILQTELSRTGVDNPGVHALSMVDLSNPELDWVRLAGGMGVEASRAETVEAFVDQLRSALAGRGPRLIEAVV